VKFELYIAGLMGLNGKREARAATAPGEKGGVMSICFCFLSSRLRRHYTHIRCHKRCEATAGGEVLSSSCGKPQELLFSLFRV
jgi:hypothetical protein